MSDEHPKVLFIEKNPRTCPVCKNGNFIMKRFLQAAED